MLMRTGFISEMWFGARVNSEEWLVLNSGGSERDRVEPKRWLKFDDVVHVRDVAHFYAFFDQYCSERGLAGERRLNVYWALFYACWGVCGCVEDKVVDLDVRRCPSDGGVCGEGNILGIDDVCRVKLRIGSYGVCERYIMRAEVAI